MLHSLKFCKFTPVVYGIKTSYSPVFHFQKKNLSALRKEAQIVPIKQTRCLGLGNAKDITVIQKRFFNQTPVPNSWRDAVYREDRHRHNNSVSYGNYSDFWNSSYLLYAIIGANVVVFLLWNTWGTERSGFREMTRNFMVSWRNLSEGRVWTLITSTISHQQPFHLLFNMLGLYFFGNSILNTLGGKRLLSIYVLGGISGSILHVAYENMYDKVGGGGVRNRRIDVPALGASGSIMSIGMLYACMFPTSTVLIWGIIPVPAVVLFGGYFLYDLYSSLNRRSSGTSHSGHVGGALFGLAYYFTRIRPYFRFR